MRRLVLPAAAIALLVTTACSEILNYDPDENPAILGVDLPLQWFISVGPQTSALFSEDGEGQIDIEAELRRAWDEQQGMMRLQEARQLADRAVREEPVDIKLTIGLVIVEGMPAGRPGVSEDGVGGYLTVFQEAARGMDHDYRVVNRMPAMYDYEFDINLDDGELHQAMLVTKVFYLSLYAPGK